MVTNISKPTWFSRDRRRRLWRGLRICGLTLVATLAVLLLIVALAPTRGALLRLALGQSQRFLPGELTVAEVAWPQPGRLEFQDLVWRTSDADTLARVSHLVVDMDLRALRDHDLFVREILVSGGPIDIPAIVSLMATETPDTSAADATKPSAWLRAGAVPGVPSLGVKILTVDARDVRLSDVLTLAKAHVEGELEARSGHEATLNLRQGMTRLVLQQAEPWHVSADEISLSLTADPEQRTFDLGGLNLQVSAAGPPAVHAAWRQAGAVTLKINGHGGWTDIGLHVELKAAGSLPGPDHLRPLLPPDFPASLAGPLNGYLELEATIADLAFPDPSGRIKLDFSETLWLERLLLVAAVEHGKATMDTLELDLLGARLAAAGTIDAEAVDMDLSLGLYDPTLLHLFGGPTMAEAQAGLDLQAEVHGAWPLPALDLDLKAFLQMADINIPSLLGRVRTHDRLVAANLWVDQGLTSGTTTLDSLRLKWDGDLTRPESLSHRFEAGAWLPEGHLVFGGTGFIDSVRTVHLDSLVVVGLDSTMRMTRPATIIHGPGPRDLRVTDFELAGGLGRLSLSCDLSSAGAELQLETDLLLREPFLQAAVPMSYWSRGGGSDLALTAAVQLGDRPDDSVFAGRAGVALLPHRDDPEVGLDVNFHLANGDSSGLFADLVLHAAEAQVLTGHIHLPGLQDPETGRWVPDPAGDLAIRFPSQNLDLSLLNQVLPPDVSLDGRLNFAAEMVRSAVIFAPDDSTSARPDLTDAKITGHLGIEQLDVTLPSRSRLALRLDTDLSGTVADPVIEGTVVVLSGYVQVPELPRNLLPVEGESLLWTTLADQATDGDSLVTATGLDLAEQGPLLVKSSPPPLPQMKVQLKIPGNLIVNGYGLNIELEGEVEVTRGQDHKGIPMAVLKGSIDVKQGSLKFMNHVFAVEKADIRFNRQAPPNPHLDFKLAADVSGYVIILEITGFADDPQVALTSNPQMNEADIMAVLLFGQPANDLTGDQRGLVREENDPTAQLRENLAAMAIVFGGAGIQNRMSQALGMDMMELGSDANGAGTLMVGKFLTPRTLLKYHQSLEKSGTYYMTLEHDLSRYFKVLSTYGQGEEGSGLELNWTRRY